MEFIYNSAAKRGLFRADHILGFSFIYEWYRWCWSDVSIRKHKSMYPMLSCHTYEIVERKSPLIPSVGNGTSNWLNRSNILKLIDPHIWMNDAVISCAMNQPSKMVLCRLGSCYSCRWNSSSAQIQLAHRMRLMTEEYTSSLLCRCVNWSWFG